MQAHPEESWQAFARAHPELNTPLNHQAWRATLPLFAADPAKLDRARYQAYDQFLFDNKLIKASRRLSATLPAVSNMRARNDRCGPFSWHHF